MKQQFAEDDVGARFMGCWMVRDDNTRRAALAALLAPDCFYTDPHYADPISGRAAYITFVDRVHSEFPQINFTMLGGSSHHGAGLLDWALKLFPDRAPSFGSFFYELDAHGHISRLTGFARANPTT